MIYSTCEHYTGRDRCRAEADGIVHSPDGRPIIRYCRPHAEATIAEYADKLGESWTFRPQAGDRSLA